jgi:two-component system nitrogen regulation sensor histidine kinase NtrY
MKLRTKYILFVVILHLVTLVLTYFIFRKHKVLFIASEALILISILVAVQLFRELIQPLQLLLQGAEAIRDRDFNVKFVPTGKFEMDELIRVYNQMIDQLRVERTKQEQQHLFLEKLIYTSPTGILILDYDEQVQEINPKAVKLLDIDKHTIMGRPVAESTHPVLREIRQLASGESKTISFNGSSTYKLQKSHFIDRGFARQFVMIEELTAEILAAEKKAYGKVIRMMAHEVNNTIGPVNSILQTTLKNSNLWKDTQAMPLQHALEIAYERNNNLNSFMRNFANVVRLPEPKPKTIDLHKLASAAAKLMEIPAAARNIQLEMDLPETGFQVYADEQQMEQVFINVLKNALEAIGEDGRVRISSEPAAKRITVTDSGKGIDENAGGQLFSPFFSTKKDGQGIGLTLVKEILVNHGCEFSLQTIQPGETNFTIRFPAD